MDTQKKILIGNWKMNPRTQKEAENIVASFKKLVVNLKKTTVVFCPPFVFLSKINELVKKNKNIKLGAQDIFTEESGSYTGEIAWPMLKGSGCDYVIIGHSERRAMGESDEIVAKKVNIAVKNGLTAVVCFGEKVRDEHGEFWNILKNQIVASLNKLNRPQLSKVIIAYEPIFAIGKSEAEALTPALLHEVVIFIRKTLSDLFGRETADKVSIIYGGSVGTKNAESLIIEGKVSGLLIGRESLKPTDFSKIASILEGISK